MVLRFPTVNNRLRDQVERKEALKFARTEAQTIIAQFRVRKSMLAKILRNVDLILQSGDTVRVYRETDRKYTGPYTMKRID